MPPPKEEVKRAPENSDNKHRSQSSQENNVKESKALQQHRLKDERVQTKKVLTENSPVKH